jgi:hypothetical protein
MSIVEQVKDTEAQAPEPVTVTAAVSCHSDDSIRVYSRSPHLAGTAILKVVHP